MNNSNHNSQHYNCSKTNENSHTWNLNHAEYHGSRVVLTEAHCTNCGSQKTHELIAPESFHEDYSALCRLEHIKEDIVAVNPSVVEGKNSPEVVTVEITVYRKSGTKDGKSHGIYQFALKRN